MTQLRDRTDTDDPRLGRLKHFDPLSRAWPIRAALPPGRPRSYTWGIPSGLVLDQGQEGACVGFAMTGELIARPSPVEFAGGITTADAFARALYRLAQGIDPWESTPPSEGTSVLAGVKTAHRAGWFTEYRWGFGIDDLIYGLGRNGPAVLGINWHESMYEPERGMISPAGRVVGGHAILARAIKIVWTVSGNIDYHRSVILLRNSWGPSWGLGGDAGITAADLADLLDAQGEAVFTIGRKTKPNPQRQETR